MIKKLGLVFLALSLVLVGAGSAEAALTFDATTVTGSTTLTLVGTTSSAVSLDSGTTGAVNVGTGAAAKTVTVGNITTTTAVNVNSGTGGYTNTTTGAGDFTVASGDDVVINGVAASDYTVGAATTTGSLTIGGTSQTSGVTTLLGGTGVGVLGGTTSGIALTPGVAGTVNIGSATGTGAITVGASTGAGQTVTVGGGATTGADIVNVGTGTATTSKTVNIATGAISAVNIGTGDFVNTIKIGDHATPVNVITIGGAASSLALADAQWSITSPGVATFVNGLVSASATLGLDTGAAGNLQLGGVNATTIGLGNGSMTALTVTSSTTGTGTVVLPTGAISTAEILDDTVGVADLAASLAFADADLVSFASVSVSSTTEGLILPQHATDCSTAGTAEGQVCWEADANILYVGDGATVTQAVGNTSGVNTWTGANTFAPTTVGDALIVGGTAQTGTITLGRSTASNTISIGSGVAADSATQTINIGNAAANGTTAGGYTVNVAATNPTATNAVYAVNIGNPATAASNIAIRQGLTGTIVLGSIAGTGAITLGSSTGDQTVNIASGAAGGSQIVNIATGTAVTMKTVNVGAVGAVAAPGTIHIADTSDVAVQLVTIGSKAAAANITTIQGGNGVGAIALTPAAAGTIVIGAAAQTGAISIGDTASSVLSALNLGTGNGDKTAINIGTGTGANGINIGTGDTGVKTIGIGTGAAANVLTIGTENGAASLEFRYGTGALIVSPTPNTTVIVDELSFHVVPIGGGAATEAETFTGLRTTAVVVCSANALTNAVTLNKSAITANTITFTFSADPGASTLSCMIHNI